MNITPAVFENTENIDDILCDDIIQFFVVVKRHLMELGEREGLTPVQLGVLHSLYRHGELAMGQMAEVLYCDASNITGIVDRLVAQGLVTRQESPRDRRTKALRLTAQGAEVVAHIRRQLPSAIGCDALDAGDCAVLRKVLHDAVTRE